MAKPKNPLFGFNARGTIAKVLTFRRRDRQTIAETIPTHPDAKSPAQLNWRTMYEACAALWHTLSDSEKLEWQKQASRKHMTAFALWQSQCLRPNPGIYLPLAGGTMQGDIAMAGHSIINSGNFLTIRKTQDQTIHNNDTPINDNELKFSVGQNEVWFFIMQLITSSETDAGVVAVFTRPDNSSLHAGGVGFRFQGDTFWQNVNNDDSFEYHGHGWPNNEGILFGILVTTDTPGIFQLQWAQFTAQDSDTTVLANSLLLASRIP
jgi:hypothetical protein